MLFALWYASNQFKHDTLWKVVVEDVIVEWNATWVSMHSTCPHVYMYIRARYSSSTTFITNDFAFSSAKEIQG